MSTMFREELGQTTNVLREYTLNEVCPHCHEDDAWIIIDEHVYDVTKFVSRHPGGKGPLLNLAGCDATDAFANYHSTKVYSRMLPAFLIGKMAPGWASILSNITSVGFLVYLTQGTLKSVVENIGNLA